jgi:signal transduction histidine kinase
MKLSRKVTIKTALGFSIYFALVNLIIFISFSEFRKEEFVFRLEEKAKTAGKLLLEVKEVNPELFKIIEKNNYNRLVNEVLIVLNKNHGVEYSSSAIKKHLWSEADLSIIREQGRLEKEDGNFDILGLYYPVDGSDYFIIIAAEDLWGNSKLRFIAFALGISFLLSLLVIWIVNRFFIQQQMKPLEKFQELISRFSFKPPLVYLSENSEIDEIQALAKAYNKLLSKVTATFESQREFNSNASHELKTPITRLAFQTEGLMNDASLPENTRNTITKIHSEIHQLSDLVNSLLLLSKIDNNEADIAGFPERIDDMVFEAYESVHRDFPEFEMLFSINTGNDNFENNLELQCLRPLVVSCFRNLLKNACLYSNEHRAELEIEVKDSNLVQIIICNTGRVLNTDEQKKLFEPFSRGKNSLGIQGYGLGLRMTRRILEKYKGEISYSIVNGKNCFNVLLHN